MFIYRVVVNYKEECTDGNHLEKLWFSSWRVLTGFRRLDCIIRIGDQLDMRQELYDKIDSILL
jgi:hypothetical protein